MLNYHVESIAVLINSRRTAAQVEDYGLDNQVIFKRTFVHLPPPTINP